jgi:DNA-binding protein Fis
MAWKQVEGSEREAVEMVVVAVVEQPLLVVVLVD